MKNYPNGKTQMKIDPEVIRALTPLFLALIGGVIGITALTKYQVDPAGFALASTAVAAAAGLAQPKGPKDE